MFLEIYKRIIANCPNKNLRYIIGDTTIKNNKVVRKQKPTLKSGYCKPWFSRTNNLYCKKVSLATNFKSNVTLKHYNIFHQLNCKNIYNIYLIEYLKCQIQYVGKSESEFNGRLNKHRKELTRIDSIPASNHFDIEGNNFNVHAKFILID